MIVRELREYLDKYTTDDTEVIMHPFIDRPDLYHVTSVILYTREKYIITLCSSIKINFSTEVNT